MSIPLCIALFASTNTPLGIDPGVGIGRVRLGETPARLEIDFGKPQQGDGAGGRFWMSWLGKNGHRLDVYAERTVDTVEAHTRFVRIDSPQFSMKNGLRIGNSLSAFVKTFPNLKQSQRGQITHFGQVTVWDDVKDGFAVEVQNKKVMGIAVHRLNVPIDASYFSYLADPNGNH